ncbi:lysosome-associated membrane glycoprotein 1-like [Homarus americanus]|uniref:lysosome-associated membrane glycoprotein 1-like n=1 Tax=Homarus americanus TaxID=6706 RepID=UPI001C439C96|nr:lysosome-associated membrane glycoprotein 1-like [Homarus americanus]
MAFKLTFVLLLLVAGSMVLGEDVMDDTAYETDAPSTTAPTEPTVTNKTTTTTTTSDAPTTTPDAPPTTTPEAPTTTPEAPTTTSEAPPTTQSPNDKYFVKDNNLTCIMIEGQISFTVNYTTNNTTKVTTVQVPKNGHVNGTCKDSDGSQVITISWGKEESISSTTMRFNKTKNNWVVSSFTASLYMDNDTFADATDVGKSLDLVIDFGLSPIDVAVNYSFSCHSTLSTKNVNGTIEEEPYKLPLSSLLNGIQIEAFNEVINEPDFGASTHCAADKTSDIVPIAVGCALAGLVVIVLIAYLVGRRRRSGAYQSV